MNCFLSVLEYIPFKKNTTKTGGTKLTYSWNNAYQNLKHDREARFSFASVHNLNSGLAALFALNLYFRNDVFDVGKDHTASSLDFGSDVFSVVVSASGSWDMNGVLNKSENFDDCIYYTDREPNYAQKFDEQMAKFNSAVNEQVLQHPKVLEHVSKTNPDDLSKGWVFEVLGSEEVSALYTRASRKQRIPNLPARYQAILNRHQV